MHNKDVYAGNYDPVVLVPGDIRGENVVLQ